MDGLVSNVRDTIVDTYGQATTFLELRAAHGVAQRQNQILKYLKSEFDDDQKANIPSCEYSDRELLHIALKQLAIINPALSTAQKWDSKDKRWNTFAAFTAYTFIEARSADTTRVTQSAFMAYLNSEPWYHCVARLFRIVFRNSNNIRFQGSRVFKCRAGFSR
jgi:hypothetical protein